MPARERALMKKGPKMTTLMQAFVAEPSILRMARSAVERLRARKTIARPVAAVRSAELREHHVADEHVMDMINGLWNQTG